MMDSWWDSIRVGLLGAAGTANIASMSRGKRSFFHVLRVFGTIGRELGSGQITLRAMGLVYTTLLSLVPLLAVSFSVLKGFGVHNQLEPFLLNLMEPIGEKGVEVTRNVLQFVDNTNVGALGAVGKLREKIGLCGNY